ncbi:hypothetical protein OEZ86_003181 [Tetradesmus obliquus]|nr:hypothetical protein OEZ86_003181 [Tetradesmus obliquus]
MFRASGPLPALHHICVASSTEASRMYGRPPSVSGQIRLLLGPRDVQRFVDSCTLGEQAPALKMAGALMLAKDVSAADVSCLPQLQLQRLTIGGPGLDDSTAEHVLANMTGLLFAH